MDDTILFSDENIITTKLWNIHQDREVPIPGFFIIVPLRKMRSLSEFTDEEMVEFISILRVVRRGMQSVLSIQDVYFFQNGDTSHGFHFWIFPRHSWMEQFGRKIESVRGIMNFAKESMLDEKNMQEVREYVLKMKKYMSDFVV